MLDSRRNYGWGYTGEPSTGYDWNIAKYDCNYGMTFELRGGRPCRTEEEAIRAAKKYIGEHKRTWTGAEIKTIKYQYGYGY